MIQSNKVLAKFAAIPSATVLAWVFTGCGGEPQNNTVPGLQEEAKVQRGQINDLKAQVEGLKTEKEVANQATEHKVEEIRREFDARQTKIEEMHRLKTAQLESEISNLRLELGGVQREKIALQAMLDRGPRIEVATSVRKGYDVMALWVLLGVLVSVLLYLVTKYRSVHDRLNLLTMQQTSELRRIGAKT